MSNENPMLQHCARLLPLSEDSSCPENREGKVPEVRLCRALGGEAEASVAEKFFDQIPGKNNFVPVGRSCDASYSKGLVPH